MSPTSQNPSLLLRLVFSLAVLALLTLGAAESYRFGNQELLYLFLGLLSVIGISGLLSVVALFSYLPAAPFSVSRIQSGSSLIKGGHLCPGWAAWFTQSKINWSAAGGTLPVDVSLQDGWEMLNFRSRMLEQGITREIHLTDWTGLFHWKLRGVIPRLLQVDPPVCRGRLAKDFYNGSDGDLESLSGKASGDVTDSRFYQSGDSIRRILWSVVARQGGLARAGDRLMVRTEEKVTNRRVALFFLPGGQNDETAAGFARACIEKDVLGDDWVFATVGIKFPTKRDRSKALGAIDKTGGERPANLDAGLLQLKEFSEKIRQGGIGKLFVILDESLVSTDRNAIVKLTSSAKGATFLAVLSASSSIKQTNYPTVIKTVVVEAV